MLDQTRYRELPLDDPRFPEVHAVLDYWRGRKGDRFAPAWTDIDLVDLPAAVIPRVCVVDVVREPRGYRYRFWGTAITDMHHYDLTGKSPTELTPPAYGAAITAQYDAVLAARAPLLFLTEVPVPGGYFTYYAVMRMPLSSDGSKVDMIMTAEEYGEQRDQLKRIFEAVWRQAGEG